MFAIPPVYILSYEFEDGRYYINDIDILPNINSRKRVWTRDKSKARKFKEEIDAMLVKAMFFDDDDPKVMVRQLTQNPFQLSI